MKVEGIIRELLTTDAGVTAIVGANVHPVALPKGNNAQTYLVTQVISNVMRPTIDGHHKQNLYQARVQVDCVAPTYAGLCALVQAARLACNFKRGTIATARVTSVSLALEGPQNFDDQQRLFVQPVDFIIIYDQGD